MRTEKIIAGSLQEAVEELKKTYGDNAVVLSSRIIRKQRWSFLPFFKTTMLEITVGIPEEEDFKKEVENRVKEFERAEMVRRSAEEAFKTLSGDQDTSDVGEGLSLRARRVLSRMVYRGVRKEIARKILEEACGYDIELGMLDFKDDIREALKDSLRRNIVLEGNSFQNGDLKVIVLIGPTGVGKTTTIAKLSYIFKKTGKRVGVITLDSYRVGAVEQLRSFVSVMELPFKIAETPKDLMKSVDELGDRDLILVDTAGRSQHDRFRLNELKVFLENLKAGIYLTLSANLSEMVMYEAIMQFGIFPIRGLIFSKMDETSYPGSVINVAYRTKLPVLCFTTGQTVPDDIVMADYDYLASLILEEDHEFRSAGGTS
ncbi:MAG: flagellar biosynthesis protein FlhF [Aquificota bacterium]|nr:flagellar biosynthesis protein FlhF [Aquificota bacterium]